jgi:cobalamin biosynthesis protein CobT
MLQDIYEIQAYAETLCRHASVKTGKKFNVSYDANTKFPYTQEHQHNIQIVLPVLKMSTSEDNLTLARHFVIHEILHHTEGPTVIKTWRDSNIPLDHSSPLNGLAMQAEDYRIEHIGSMRYRGDAQSINDATGIVLKMYANKLANMTQEQKDMLSTNKYAAGTLAALLTDLQSRNSWCPSTVGADRVLKNTLPTSVSDMMQKLIAIDYPNMLLNMRTEQDAADAAKAAFKALYDEDPEEQNKDEDGKEKGKEKGDQQGNEGEEGNSGDKGEGGEGEDKPTKAKENKKDKGEETNAFEDTGKKIDYRDYLLSNHKSKKESKGGSGAHFDYTNYDWRDRDFHPCPPSEMIVRDYVNPNLSRNDDGGKSGSNRRETRIDGEAASSDNAFANRVRKLVQVRSQSRYIGGKTKGKINRKQVYRVGVPTVGNGEWNSRVFKTRFQDEVLDTVIQLVVDSSGSMHGTKYAMAIKSATMLNDAFDRILHMPVEVLAFSEYGGRNAIGIIKKHTKSESSGDIVANFRDFARDYMSSNNDGDAISFAASRLRQAKQKRKIMIVLSDGSPASRRGDCATYTANIIKEIENKKEIEIYAIGIKDDCVKDFYTNFKVISRTSELESAIIDVIKHKLLD